MTQNDMGEVWRWPSGNGVHHIDHVLARDAGNRTIFPRAYQLLADLSGGILPPPLAAYVLLKEILSDGSEGGLLFANLLTPQRGLVGLGIDSSVDKVPPVSCPPTGFLEAYSGVFSKGWPSRIGAAGVAGD